MFGVAASVSSTSPRRLRRATDSDKRKRRHSGRDEPRRAFADPAGSDRRGRLKSSPLEVVGMRRLSRKAPRDETDPPPSFPIRPRTGGVRQKPGVSETGILRRERQFLKQAANASVRPEAQQPSEANERRKSTSSAGNGGPRGEPADSVWIAFAMARHRKSLLVEGRLAAPVDILHRKRKIIWPGCR
jgi:hypothetical protein